MYYNITFLNHISNTIMFKSSTINDLTLFSGKMGISIFFMYYSRFTKNKTYNNFANELIDDIYEDINEKMPINFSNGLAGIGWGFLHLIDQGFIKGDPMLILRDIDNKIYHIIEKNTENAYEFIYPYLIYRISFPLPIYTYNIYNKCISKRRSLDSFHSFSLPEFTKTNLLNKCSSKSNGIGLSGLSGAVLNICFSQSLQDCIFRSIPIHTSEDIFIPNKGVK